MLSPLFLTHLSLLAHCELTKDRRVHLKLFFIGKGELIGGIYHGTEHRSEDAAEL